MTKYINLYNIYDLANGTCLFNSSSCKKCPTFLSTDHCTLIYCNRVSGCYECWDIYFRTLNVLQFKKCEYFISFIQPIREVILAVICLLIIFCSKLFIFGNYCFQNYCLMAIKTCNENYDWLVLKLLNMRTTIVPSHGLEKATFISCSAIIFCDK